MAKTDTIPLTGRQTKKSVYSEDGMDEKQTDDGDDDNGCTHGNRQRHRLRANLYRLNKDAIDFFPKRRFHRSLNSYRRYGPSSVYSATYTSIQDLEGLPLPDVPSDELRKGLTTFEEKLVEKHPVQVIQERDGEREKLRSLRDIYGLALPARMHIEKQILTRGGRLPPLTSSTIGYETYFGELSTFGPDSYLGLREYSERAPPDLHERMETRTKSQSHTTKRGFL